MVILDINAMKTHFIAILLVALLVACQPTETSKPVPQTQETGTARFVIAPPAETKTDAVKTPIPTPSDSKQIVPETKTFNVEAFQFGYEPSEIRVKVGDKVHIHLTTRDVSHSFSIRDLKVSISTSPGVPGDGEFVADKTGTFRWHCGIPCGSGHKIMSGQLIVE
jgi:heme/copper-type cytochrome/quinol oxidase subunit 2